MPEEAKQLFCNSCYYTVLPELALLYTKYKLLLPTQVILQISTLQAKEIPVLESYNTFDGHYFPVFLRELLNLSFSNLSPCQTEHNLFENLPFSVDILVCICQKSLCPDNRLSDNPSSLDFLYDKPRLLI